MASSEKQFFGLDIGGTAIKAVVLSGREILSRHECSSDANQGPHAVKKSILEAIHQLTKLGFTPSGVGLGCAGSVDHANGTVRNSPNFSDWNDVPLQSWICKALEMQNICVENDANCATLAEWRLTELRSARNLMLLTLGTGIGGGLVLDGSLYRGSTGTAGEIGHFSIDANGVPCACGNIGCLERYCSATALTEKFPGLSAKEIFEKRSASPFKQAVDEFIHRFKVALTSIANLFDPQYILLGGAVSQGLAPDLNSIQNWVRSHAFKSVAKNTQIQLTQFGNWSGAIGAAVLVAERPTELKNSVN